MPHRAPSPAISENEFDISKALLDGDGSSDHDTGSRGRNGGWDNGQDISKALEHHSEDEEADEDEAFIAAQQATSNRKASNLKGKTVKKGGGFQVMGLNALLLKAITKKGFSVPTPIQRKTIPLVLDNQDVVGMARTGSGKTAAFVIPMIEKLKAHSAKIGARAVILSPSRELALQTLKVVKELGRGTDLRTVLLVGGDSLEDQFGDVANNPDIIIATPGRFLHLKIEMELDLSSVKYIVFDEADRLFEMGFAAQLTEILHALPATRQSLLFSATLPKSLAEFARAGLQEPKLIRLDAESKVSPDLESAFFTVKSAEKEGALLHILQDVIKMPTGPTEAALRTKEQATTNSKKRKRGPEVPNPNESPTAHSTIVFAATKHHVEYLATLLRSSGYSVSYIYGNLDQTARKMQVQDFRSGMTNILVVTDVAARGIDIPILANVINYDFPSQPKIFVHRVGRTARAGMKGWSYNLVSEADVPYLLDLQLFLSRRLILGRIAGENVSFAEDVVVGSLVREMLERRCEYVAKLLDEDADLAALRTVASKGEKMYTRSRNSASSESAKRAKDVLANKSSTELNMLFNDDVDGVQLERERMLARVSGFRPQETVFEIGKRGTGSEAAEMMRKRREKIDPRRRHEEKNQEATTSALADTSNHDMAIGESDGTFDMGDAEDADMASASEEELEITFSQPDTKAKSTKGSWQDSEHFMSYTPKSLNLAEDRGYGVHSGSNSNFVEAARGATMDLTNDESKGFGEPTRARGMRWDKKSKKYVARANDEDGSRGAKLVRGESGQKIAASFRAGRFDAWKKSQKISRLPRVGEVEAASSGVVGSGGVGKRYKHKAEKAPKEADRFRDDYYKRKKRVDDAKERRVGKFRDGVGAKTELRGVDDVTKQRRLKEKRREKNARPGKKRKV